MKIVKWPGQTPYPEGMRRMEEALSHTLATGEESIIFCEHEQVLTIGTSGNEADLGTSTIPFLHTGRGGKVTYHGPGQRVVYLVINLKRFNSDIRAYVQWLQNWLIAALAELGITTTAGTGDEIGVWINNHKVAAIGVRVRKGIAYHGIALNLNPDLSVYTTFIPCGLTQKGVTSLHAEGKTLSMDELDTLLQSTLTRLLPPLA